MMFSQFQIPMAAAGSRSFVSNNVVDLPAPDVFAIVSIKGKQYKVKRRAPTKASTDRIDDRASQTLSFLLKPPEIQPACHHPPIHPSHPSQPEATSAPTPQRTLPKRNPAVVYSCILAQKYAICSVRADPSFSERN